jgi:hypothetical protein
VTASPVSFKKVGLVLAPSSFTQVAEQARRSKLGLWQQASKLAESRTAVSHLQQRLYRAMPLMDGGIGVCGRREHTWTRYASNEVGHA